jgi:hypothetical protein
MPSRTASHSHDSSILSNSLNRKKNRTKAKLYQSPKSISSSRFSNSEINESSSLNTRDDFSTLGSEKESININIMANYNQIQAKKSKIVPTSNSSNSKLKSRIFSIDNNNYENQEHFGTKRSSSNSQQQRLVKSDKSKIKTRSMIQPCTAIKQIPATNKKIFYLNSNSQQKTLASNIPNEECNYPVLNQNTIEQNVEHHDIIPVNIKKNLQEKCKIANIKHFSSRSSTAVTNYENDNFYEHLGFFFNIFILQKKTDQIQT